jgi:secondary thiamine-phosphate synthase enzyme
MARSLPFMWNLEESAMLKMARHSLSLSTRTHRQFLDLTSQVREQVKRAEVADGLVVVNTLHTTCCLLVNEFQGALVDDLTELMERLVADDGGYKHNDPRYSDCERGNGAAHLRAGLLGQSVVVGLSAGELSLGRFQSILFCEWDGPRTRSIDIQIIGA